MRVLNPLLIHRVHHTVLEWLRNLNLGALIPSTTNRQRGSDVVLQMMLCGAHDAGELSDAFVEVAQGFGATPWFYQSGTILHVNAQTARWTENSRATIGKADVCVFVMLDKFGDITWNHELQEALELGKPFVILALESAWLRYTHLTQHITDPSAIESPDDQKMVHLLRMISSDYELTVSTFTYSSFKEKLRAQLGQLTALALQLLQVRNHRASLIESLKGGGRLVRNQIDRLKAMAVDEYEPNKIARKMAIRRLAGEGLRDDDFVIDLARSAEQGVQRLVYDLLPELLPRPLNEDLVRELAHIASKMDDVGVPRRLITSVTNIDPTYMDIVLEASESPEQGIRRRAYEGVEEHWDAVLRAWGAERMVTFLYRCEAEAQPKAGWLERLRQVRAGLEGPES